MDSRLARVWFALGSFAIAGYFALPLRGWSLDLWYDGIGAAATLAIAFGALRHRPRPLLPWLLFAFGQGLWVAGDGILAVYGDLFGHTPYPSAADIFYLAGYPVFAAGLLLLVRGRSPGRDLESLLDAAIVTTGIAAVTWVFLMEPYTRDSTTSLLAKLASISYPLGDLLLLAVSARLLMGPRGRSGVLLLIGPALLLQLAGDAAYGVQSLHGTYVDGGAVDGTWLAAYVIWAAAALHPAMRRLGEPVAEVPRQLTPWRLLLLTAATLLAPAMTVLRALHASNLGLSVTAFASIVLFVLVIVRMAGVVANQRAAQLREEHLREAAAGLVAARDRDEMYRIAVDTAFALSKQGGERRASFGVGDFDRIRIVASHGLDSNDLVGVEFDVRPLVDDSIVAGGALDVDLFAGSSQPHLVAVPLIVQDETRGVLTLRSRQRLPQPVRDALETLGAQVALALESAALNDDLLERQSQERFRSLVQNSFDVIAILEPDLTVRYHTPSVEAVLGYGPAALVDTSFAELVDPAERTQLARLIEGLLDDPAVPGRMECRLLHCDGSWRTFEALFSNLLTDPNVRGIVVTAHDVTERIALERQLTHQAFHDALTNLPNRALFVDRVQHAVDRMRRSDTTSAVLFVDLDDFKTVNDSLGHAAGDELLIAVAERLSGAVRPSDTAARFGGDEFAILVEDLVSESEATVIAGRLLEEVAKPLPLQGQDLVLAASIGIAFARGGQTPGDLLRNADTAMYTAKSGGKGRWATFEPRMRAAAFERLELKAELHRALERDELVVHYQPLIALASGEIVAFEALVRWHHPKRGLIPPGAFIPALEESGLIVPAGARVLHTACAAAMRWPAAPGGVERGVSVNLSGRQLLAADVVGDVEAALRTSGLAPERLVLEITESVLMDDADAAIGQLTALKQLGVHLAIDDFGTGYSSLEYLRRFPIDAIKIAKPFVDGVGASGDASLLAEAIFRLGSTLGLQSVAEGVELPVQRDVLAELGCDLAQGFLFSRPVPEHATLALLERADEPSTAAA